LKVKTQLYYITCVYQTMVTANNYMFRPLTGHHRVVHLMKRAEDYNMHCNYRLMTRSRSSYHTHYNQFRLGKLV